MYEADEAVHTICPLLYVICQALESPELCEHW